jgi:hypothetical protein
MLRSISWTMLSFGTSLELNGGPPSNWYTEHDQRYADVQAGVSFLPVRGRAGCRGGRDVMTGYHRRNKKSVPKAARASSWNGRQKKWSCLQTSIVSLLSYPHWLVQLATQPME